jgi:hypothetical protein
LPVALIGAIEFPQYRRLTVPRFVAVLLILLLPAATFPQSSKPPKQGDNLYADALISSITEMQKQWGYINDSDQGIRTDYNHMIVVKNPEITYDLPSQFEDHRVEYLDNNALGERHRELKKDFSVLEIHPMHNEGKRLRIQVSLSWIEYKKNRLQVAISSWSNVEFQYDCDKQTYVISSVKLGGI